MSLLSARTLTIALVGMAAITTGGCTKLRSHQGYIIDADLVNSIQPGVDTRQSILQTLGKPTFTSQFNAGDWYYWSRDSRNFAFNRPAASDQTTLRIRFDARGTVVGVDKGGKDLIASISPSDKKTPTLGRDKSFLQDLFGNIGTVGAGPGAGGGPQQ